MANEASDVAITNEIEAMWKVAKKFPMLYKEITDANLTITSTEDFWITLHKRMLHYKKEMQKVNKLNLKKLSINDIIALEIKYKKNITSHLIYKIYVNIYSNRMYILLDRETFSMYIDSDESYIPTYYNGKYETYMDELWRYIAFFCYSARCGVFDIFQSDYLADPHDIVYRFYGLIISTRRATDILDILFEFDDIKKFFSINTGGLQLVILLCGANLRRKIETFKYLVKNGILTNEDSFNKSTDIKNFPNKKHIHVALEIIITGRNVELFKWAMNKLSKIISNKDFYDMIIYINSLMYNSKWLSVYDNAYYRRKKFLYAKLEIEKSFFSK